MPNTLIRKDEQIVNKAIPVPKILPNNLKQIRQIRGLTLQDAANILNIHPFFLSSVENGKNNLSGKITMNVLHLFDVSFEQLYDVRKELELDYIEEYKDTVTVDVILNKSEIEENPIKIEEKILDELLKKNINAQVYTYEIVEKKETFKSDMYLCTINLELVTQKIKKRKFDINFFRDSNIELTEILLERGFLEQPQNIRLGKDKFKVVDHNIYLNREYKISADGQYNSTNKIYIGDFKHVNGNKYSNSDGSIKLYKSEEDDINLISFTALEEDMTNLKFIENYYEKHENLDKTKIPELLGLSVPGYSNLLHGNQKISTKVMWRMVKLFRVPLELIINIKKYTEEIYQIDSSN